MSSYKSAVVECSSPQNAKAAKNAFLLTSGALLLLPILKKRSVLRWTTAAAGSALIYCGMKSASERSRSRSGQESGRGVEHLAESITIGRSASDLFALWRDPDALRRILRPFADVQFGTPNHLRWSASLAIGTLDAEAVMVEDRPGDLVHWQTVPESNLRIDEYMRFRPAPQGPGTEATLTYDIDFSRVPAGPVLQALTSLFEQAPRALVRKLLHNFKSLAETGEIPTLEGGPSGREGDQGSTDESTESPE